MNIYEEHSKTVIRIKMLAARVQELEQLIIADMNKPREKDDARDKTAAV